MSKWKEYQLIELASNEVNSFIDGDWIESPHIKDSGIRLIQTGNIGKGYFRDGNKKYISEDSFNRLNCKEVKAGDLLICRLAEPIGRSCCVPNLPTKNITSVDVTIFRIDENRFDKNFILQVINTDAFLNKANEVAGGSTRQRISRKNLASLKIVIPEKKSEQRQIAHILSTCDAVIEKTQSAISKYKAIKQSMLHDLFTRGIDIKTGKLRPKYEDAPELYKESKLGLIPKEWDEDEIGKLSSIVTNGFVGVATPYYTNSNEGVPYLFGTNVRADFIDFNNLRYISKDFHNSHIKSQLKPGDMLCVQSGHIGTCAVVPEGFTEANCHALIITRFYKDVIFPEFISFYLNSEIGKRELDKIIIGSTVKHINTSELARHIIPKPIIDEQNAIAKRLEVINIKIDSEQNYLSKVQQIKSGLMNDLLSGKKKVKLIEDLKVEKAL